MTETDKDKVCGTIYKEGEQLENYTKYKLKSDDELKSLLADKDNLFIVCLLYTSDAADE